MVTFCQIVVEYNQDIDIDAAQQLYADLYSLFVLICVSIGFWTEKFPKSTF